MLLFLSVAFSIYASMHLYALNKLWQVMPHSVWAGVALIGTGFMMALLPFILWQISRYNWHSATVVFSWLAYVWMGFIFLFCCTALVGDLAHLLATITGLKWPLSDRVTLLSSAVITFALLGYGMISARTIQVEEIKIMTPKLSPDAGIVRIAQISDLHLGIMLGEEFLQRLIDELHTLKPDIVVATGDVLDGQGDDLVALAEQFHALHPPMGLFAVNGNHEYFAGLESSLRFLRNAGFTVLRGEAVRAGGIVLLGVDDSTAHAMGQEARLDTTQALASVTPQDFIVLLKHQPVADRNTPFDLQLSGHVHGGQIFPFGLLTRMVYGVSTGLTRLDDGRLLYVNRGTGTWGPPLRLLAAPEITLLTIESAGLR